MDERELLEELKKADLSRSIALIVKFNVAQFDGDVDRTADKLKTSQAAIYRRLAILREQA